MRGKFAFVAVLAAIAVAVVAPAGASAAPTAGAVQLPVTCTDPATGAVAQCTAELVGFTGSGSTVNAVMKITNVATGATTTVTQPIAAAPGSTCTILDLTIPPIHLELLGLVVDTSTIHVVITAQRGTLLGNLLCGLFFPGTQQSGAGVAAVLNQLLRQGLIGV
jgi:hypothetical protein